jgi:peptide/nickel transport system ATP-binding protein/oligopeptide transport system ATP-binding protein
MTMDKTILRVQGLKTHFFTSYGTVKAVDGVDFHIKRGETLGLVGESGCGLSVTSLSFLRLVPVPPGKIISGKILFDGTNLLDLTDEEMRKIRGAKIAMSFQDPMTYLNPVKKVGEQVAEAILLHQDTIKDDAKEKTVNIMELVGIPSARERYNDYPHQFSGGMRQRIMIAIALSCNPDILIADEPTTNLDVLVQDQILELIKELQRELNTSIIMITHDLGVVAEVSDRVAVMYAGKIVEIAKVMDLFNEPLHPYTQGLLNSIPIIGAEKKRLSSIGGVVPNLIDPMPGCVFEPRCPKAMKSCKTRPIIKDINGRIVACHLYG